MIVERLKSKVVADLSYFVASHASAIVVDPQRGVQPYIDLAKKHGIPKDKQEAFRKKLERIQKARPEAFVNIPDRRGSQSRYLYKESEVMDIIEAFQNKGKKSD